MKALVPYLVIINAAALLFMLIDKQNARLHRWRIPEAVLFITAFIGGCPGIYLGMWLFHHKTRKPAFAIGMPAMILAYGILIWYFIL